MSFERKIYLCLALLVLGFLPIVTASFLSVREVVNEQQELSSKHTQALLFVEQLKTINAHQSSLMPVFVLTGNAEFLLNFEKGYQEFLNVVILLSQSEDDPRVHAIINNLRTNFQKAYDLAGAGIQMRLKGDRAEKVNRYFEKNTQPLNGDVIDLLTQLDNQVSENRNFAKKSLEARIYNIELGLAALSLLALGLVILVSRLLINAIGQKRQVDQTQKFLMDQETRISQARKETLEIVAHDLKNPLGTIKMSGELLQDELREATPLTKRCLDIIQRSAESMERLIMDLLDHAKIESGNLVLETKKADLGLVIPELVKRFEPLTRKKEINLSCETNGSVVVDCDVARIEQVISNLLGNALKFSESNGQIIVRLESYENTVSVSVKDSGPGIEASKIPYIFNRFWQDRSTASQGTGLGLAIARSIVEAHDGQIWVESEVGQGSKFCFSLPRLNAGARNSTHGESRKSAEH